MILCGGFIGYWVYSPIGSIFYSFGVSINLYPLTWIVFSSLRKAFPMKLLRVPLDTPANPTPAYICFHFFIPFWMEVWWLLSCLWCRLCHVGSTPVSFLPPSFVLVGVAWDGLGNITYVSLRSGSMVRDLLVEGIKDSGWVLLLAEIVSVVKFHLGWHNGS